jgi:hypothetical protein
MLPRPFPKHPTQQQCCVNPSKQLHATTMLPRPNVTDSSSRAACSAPRPNANSKGLVRPTFTRSAQSSGYLRPERLHCAGYANSDRPSPWQRRGPPVTSSAVSTRRTQAPLSPPPGAQAMDPLPPPALSPVTLVQASTMDVSASSSTE